MRDIPASFIASEDAGVAIEYALIAGIVSICIVGGATSIKGTLQSIFTKVAAGFP